MLVASLVHIRMCSKRPREEVQREEGLDTNIYSHLEAAHDECLPKHRAQGQRAGAYQSICVQIFVVKQINAKYFSIQMS